MTLLVRSALGALAMASLFGLGAARADEGMWTLDNFPSDKVAKTYGFKPDRQWLDHVRMSSVRLAGGCSAAFVSPNGLVQTNHHCAHSCIEQLSTPTADIVASGFYAAKAEDEKMCPQIEANQLVAITDVTDQIGRATANLEGKAFADALKGAQASIAKDCAKGDDAIRCDVVELYHGGLYHLYKYRRFQDVRLVMAPEFAIAFFGGDPDNFEFPRYDLDVSYLRVYDHGKPLDTSETYFKYAKSDVKPGDLVFTAGHPGSTSRLDTVAELEFDRDVAFPRTLLYWAELRGVLTQFMTKGPEQRRIATDLLFGIENSYKNVRGKFEALVDPGILRQRAQAETELRARIDADPALKATYGGSFDRVAEAMNAYRDLRDRYVMTEGGQGLRSGLLVHARTLVRYAAESAKPDEQRLREYTTANFPSRRQGLLSSAPVYPELEKTTLTFSLTKLRETLGPDDPLVRKVFGKRSAAEIASDLVDHTSLVDPAARKRLLEGGAAAIDASTDPMIVFFRSIDPDLRRVRQDYENNVKSVLDKNSGLIAQAMFKIYGSSTYPDATFTLRVSYGAVQGYKEKGREVYPITKFAGLYERANGPLDPAAADDPFRLPQRWYDAKPQLNLDQAFNIASTNDIIGGNSGSPVINRDLEVVGLIFDGNIQSLGGDFGYDGTSNRAVSVAVGALREALAKVYKADRIVKELSK